MIDGKLDDKVWQSLKPIAIGTDAPGTIARACYDAENLYIAFECEELPGRTTQGTPKDRDGKVWEGRCHRDLLETASRREARSVVPLHHQRGQFCL